MAHRVYIDTNFVIRFIESQDAGLASVLDRAESGLVDLVTSELSLAEVLVHPLQTGEVCPISRSVLRLAADIRARYRDKLPDAIHVATAIKERCSTSISSDRGLRVPPGIRRLGLDELADRWP